MNLLVFFFFFKQKTAYEIGVRLVGSEMCIRDSTDCGRMDRSVHDIGCGAICEDDVAGT